MSMFALTHSWNLGNRNWRRTAIRLVNVSGWRKGTEPISPKKSTRRLRPTLNHPRCTLRHLRLRQEYSRRIRAPFRHISRPRHLQRFYPPRHRLLCWPRPRSMQPLHRRFFRPQAHPLQLILKPQISPPIHLHNLTPAFPTKHRRQ
ncbi:hypothetical protein CRG98_012120 [Punica granatum]|uniref:Uncharacterized protein n=1 Tax=Punica granatum TaxID=22663 RepID=A0A2I0KI88_PUNGR|nr:hypothetical protein CRG98_012120 [Punica granatum]